ncbi:dUTP diphosphatase [Anaeromicrobium sediminis]|nr:dUTP diphosphatase [Anaeromicrobium sediminis]
MELNELFKVQEIMENHIKKLSNIDEEIKGKENLFDLKFLALQVKTGEIANTTKCYKYYKVKKIISKEKLLIRYIDALKFLLSIGNDHNFNIINEEVIDKSKYEDNIIKLFSYIYDDITDLKKSAKKDDYFHALNTYVRLFTRYLNLAELIGLNFSEIYSYYMENIAIELE